MPETALLERSGPVRPVVVEPPREASAGPLLAQAVLLVATARTFLPTAYELLAQGRPLAGTQLEPSAAGATLTRLLTVALCLCVLAFLAVQPRLRLPGLAVAAGATVAASGLSAVHAGGSSLLAPLLAVAVLYVALSAGLTHGQALVVARRCLAPVVLLSLLLGVLAPQAAKYGLVDAPWGSRDGRLAGITAQPNMLGTVAGCLLVVLLAGRRTRAAVGLALAGLVALWLTQSYTSWLATVAAGLVVVSASRRRDRGSSPWLLATGALVLVTSTLLLAVRVGVPETLGTVSGRAALWGMVGQGWPDRPWLGAGPQVWARLVEAGELPTWAVHAHNQVLDTLFTGGLLGAAALAVLLGLLVVHAARRWAVGHALGAGLVAFQLVRCYSEVPYQLFYGGLNVLLLALAGAALLAGTAQEEPA